MDRARILVVDDKENILALMTRILNDAYDVTTASDGNRAISLIAEQEFDVILTDLRMPGADGFEVLRAAEARAPDTEVIMMTAHGTVQDAVTAMEQGAFDYLFKPFDSDDALLVVARALERRRLRAQTQTLRSEVEGMFSWPGNARGLENALERAVAVAKGKMIELRDLPTDVKGAQEGAIPGEVLAEMLYPEAVDLARDRVSRDYLTVLMREHEGNVPHAAQHAGMQRESLHRLLKRYGISSDDFKKR